MLASAIILFSAALPDCMMAWRPRSATHEALQTSDLVVVTVPPELDAYNLLDDANVKQPPPPETDEAVSPSQTKMIASMNVLAGMFFITASIFYIQYEHSCLISKCGLLGAWFFRISTTFYLLVCIATLCYLAAPPGAVAQMPIGQVLSSRYAVENWLCAGGAVCFLVGGVKDQVNIHFYVHDDDDDDDADDDDDHHHHQTPIIVIMIMVT
jgi:hypothetical protein